MTIMPNFVLILRYTVIECDGSYLEMLSKLFKNPFNFLYEIWTSTGVGSIESIYFLIGFIIFSAASQILVPGNTVYGPLTPKGNRPEYADNGFRCYILVLIVFAIIQIF